jgi:hypothetical protein
MTKNKEGKSNSQRREKIGDAIQGLLDRIREGAQELAGMLNPQKPAVQPVPVRRPSNVPRRLR